MSCFVLSLTKPIRINEWDGVGEKRLININAKTQPLFVNRKMDEPDVVMLGCGDIPTKEVLAATALLRD